MTMLFKLITNRENEFEIQLRNQVQKTQIQGRVNTLE